MVTLVLSLTPVRGEAVDFAGTWVGKIKCRGSYGIPYKSERQAVLSIAPSGHDVAVEGSGFHTIVVDDFDNNTKGRLLLVSCGTAPGPSLIDVYADIVHLVGKVNPLKGSGSLKGLEIRGGQVLVPNVATCTWSFKRISTLAPVVASCF